MAISLSYVSQRWELATLPMRFKVNCDDDEAYRAAFFFECAACLPKRD